MVAADVVPKALRQLTLQALLDGDVRVVRWRLYAAGLGEFKMATCLLETLPLCLYRIKEDFCG